MDDSHKREFAQTLQGLGEVRGKPLSKAALSVYWLALSDWDISEFRAVAKHLLTHSQFMPTPYDFEQARKVDDTADEAWLQVLQAIRTRYHSEATSINPKIDHVVRLMGGYAGLSLVNTDDMVWRQKRFAELYEDANDIEERRTLLDYDRPTSGLIGIKTSSQGPRLMDFSRFSRPPASRVAGQQENDDNEGVDVSE